MDFEIRKKPSKRAWRIDYISVGSKKELQLLLLLLGTEVLEKLLISLILMLLII
jgi:hypothetical protein